MAKLKRKYLKILITILVFSITLVMLGYSLFFYILGFNSEIGIENFSPKYLKNQLNEIEKFQEVRRIVENRYIEKTDQKVLMDAAYGAYLDELGDKYSRYLSSEYVEAYSLNREGAMIGIGIEAIKDFENLKVIIKGFLEDSVAKEAGIELDDEIIAVNELKLSEVGIDKMLEAVVGDVGEEVIITVYRPSEEKELVFNLVRAKIRLSYVKGERFGDVGYIKIQSFKKEISKDFDEELEKIREIGELSGLIIDLRGNGGGSVKESVAIANRFLSDGIVFYTLDQQGNRYDYEADEKADEIELAVLIDSRSASASEILAGSLKDRGRAKLFGEKSYGKGIMQTEFYLDDGSVVIVTTKENFLPSDKMIHEIGIEPDMAFENQVTDLSDEDKVFKAALEYFKTN